MIDRVGKHITSYDKSFAEISHLVLDSSNDNDDQLKNLVLPRPDILNTRPVV